MSDLIDKLNILVRARINNALGGPEGHSTPRSANRTGDDTDNQDRFMQDPRAAEREIADLRSAIDQALNTEDTMQQKLDVARKQVAELDSRADQALLNGDDLGAREAVQRLKTFERTVYGLEADLSTHRRATSQLIEQVNHLEAILADRIAQQNESRLPEMPGTETASTTTEKPRTSSIPIRVNVPDAVKPEPQPESVEVAVKIKPESAIPSLTPQEQIHDEIERATVEDDLARRRVRLSAPDKPTP